RVVGLTWLVIVQPVGQTACARGVAALVHALSRRPRTVREPRRHSPSARHTSRRKKLAPSSFRSPSEWFGMPPTLVGGRGRSRRCGIEGTLRVMRGKEFPVGRRARGRGRD